MRLGIGIGIPPSGGILALPPLLDSYTTGLTGAWSGWQKLLSSYAGAARRLRRSSDNAELDIGFKADNTLDEAAVAAHIGGGSGFDVTLYNQQGTAGRNFGQSTAAAQPGYTTIGARSRPALDFDGSDDRMATTAALGDFIDAGNGYVIVASLVDSIGTDHETEPSANDPLFGSPTGDAGLHLKSTGNTFQAYNFDGNNDVASASISLGALTIFEWRHESGTLYQRVNGAGETSTASGNTGVTSACHIGGRTLVAFADLKITDVITYDTVPPLATRDAIVAALIARLT